MPNPQFTKPWHGVAREEIHWNPTIIEDACIGCGTCVTGCSRLVYRFDFDRKKPVVIDPLNCMVGCTTCANTCPAHAISFPALETVLALEGLGVVRHAIEDDLLARHDILATTIPIPHPDKIVTLEVASVEHLGEDVLRLRLRPVVAGECFCEFVPGQYIELWQPESTNMSRAYSIANAPEGDGSVELHIRRIEGGRFTEWAFTNLKVGEKLRARGPLGQFTMRSRSDTRILFLAGGTGIAPILALLRQQARFNMSRDMVLVWGAKDALDFYALDEMVPLLEQLPSLRIILAKAGGEISVVHERLEAITGNVLDAMVRDEALLPGRDIYAAGSAPMLRSLGNQLDLWHVDRARIYFDAFSV
jgi:CDP-4-dehydro-6-deoxyglucose reductase